MFVFYVCFCFIYSDKSWHEEAARKAQNWANHCQRLDHATPAGRWTHNYGSCGQNIFISTHHVPW